MNIAAPGLFPVFFSAGSIEILDGLACALLAASAACRARGFGGNIAGVAALGCICGLLCPLLRETFLHGADGAKMIISSLPDDAFIGSLAGALAPAMLPAKKGKVFFWIDSVAITLAGALAAVLGIASLGIVGALALGLVCGLIPGLCRDVAMGDIAMFIERTWYAASVAIASMAAMALLATAPYWGNGPFLSHSIGEWSVAGGATLAICLKAWRDRDSLD